MEVERCDECGSKIVIGLGCECPPGSSASASATPRSVGTFVRTEWRTHPEDTILISPAQCAHRPGWCDHMTEDDVQPPRWGWIPDPPPGLWERLSSASPATATAGNPRRRAVRRCTTCEANLAQG
ncbi:hypothetical protein GCM10010251_22640 [Streptomyces aurantiogriseus]|uniref:Uncharacterized protein n=1 Tax=Streptomyces aurantiogriseus TaxID=66870 RepID=A0A918F3Y6_9ACTN|nr:hypothetical protein GCM10010251_22640 [Streptomyces aurantiogriseus]